MKNQAKKHRTADNTGSISEQNVDKSVQSAVNVELEAAKEELLN